jgi:DNA polymerase III alpha subunit
MRIDKYSRQILNENDLCHIFLADPTIIVKNAIIESPINNNPELDLLSPIDMVFPNLVTYSELDIDIETFDTLNQNNWFVSEEYKELDIAKYVLDKCKTDEELQRTGSELILFLERDMFPLLRYCKYLVDTMREHNIVWGVGRGSSVSSYVLYLIGIHRINSIHYDLSIDEFLK